MDWCGWDWRLRHVKVWSGWVWRGRAVKARSGRVRCGAAGFGGYGSVRLVTERKAWWFRIGADGLGLVLRGMAVGARFGRTGRVGFGEAVSDRCGWVRLGMARLGGYGGARQGEA